MPGLPVFSRAPRRIGKYAPGQVEELSAGSHLVLDRVSFTVQQGDIFGLVGESGSGKSTLIRLLAALIKPDSGEASVFGYDVARQPAQVQYLTNRVSVNASSFKQLSALDNLVFGARQYGMNAVEARRWAAQLLMQLGLDEQMMLLPLEALSRCQQQVVVIARAMVSRPHLLLLDEPLSALDHDAKRCVLQTLHQFREIYGTTILIATRNWIEAIETCDCIAVLSEGKIISLETRFQASQIHQLFIG
jgi:ABC-2 type transport system ATP-binding protein